MHPRLRSFALLLVTLSLGAAAPHAQTAAAPRPSLVAPAPLKLTTPEQFFGHQIGDDYVLPNYTKFTEYVRRLDAESDRMIVQSIGKTAEGRDQLMAIITAPENFKRLDRYQEIARRLSQAEGLTDDQARALAKEGKAVVWIDGGLHATEVLGAQQLIETIYQFASRTDEETLRILRDVIILAAHANPDGMELVSDWYMRKPDPKQRSTSGIPRLYQKYVGHDNNRDFYMMNQPESVNINRMLYRVWFPQIVYNHHQTGPTGTVMFSPPFRDPFNYNYDPLVVNTLDQVGAAMHARFDQEGKPGVTTRSGANYSTWWNGGLRTMPYFHNQVGLLTESIGNPTPEQIGFVPDRLLPRGDLPAPIPPQTWHFRQSIDYSITANYAVLDFAQRYRETLLFNMYVMGRNSIRKGGTDTWTMSPKRIAAVKAEIAKEMQTEAGDARMVAGGRAQPVPTKYYELLKKPEWRDPRTYVIPADKGDFLTATKFVNIMIRSGLTVHRATGPVSAAGKTYPAGSYVFKAAQPYRPHLMDMFEPQDHPNDFQFPGGPPIPPYDSTGWTLAYQMGLAFDRLFEDVTGPLEKIPGRGDAGGGPGHGRAGRGGLHGPTPRQRRIHRGEPPAEGRGRGVLRRRPLLPEPGWHGRAVHHREAVNRRRAAEGRDRLRPELCRRDGAARGRALQAHQAAHRAVGSVRRLDALGPPALAARAVRVRLRGDLPLDSGRGESRGQVPTSSSFLMAASPRPIARPAAVPAALAVSPRAEDVPSRVSRPPGPRHHRAHGAAIEALCRRRRRDRRLWRIRGARLSPGPAGQRSHGGSAGRREREGAACHQVLHSRRDPPGGRRQHQPTRVRAEQARRRGLRQQSRCCSSPRTPRCEV